MLRRIQHNTWSKWLYHVLNRSTDRAEMSHFVQVKSYVVKKCMTQLSGSTLLKLSIFWGVSHDEFGESLASEWYSFELCISAEEIISSS